MGEGEKVFFFFFFFFFFVKGKRRKKMVRFCLRGGGEREGGWFTL